MRAKAICAVVLATLLRGASADAEFLSTELQVNGLSCPFCAFGIEKKLLDVDGARDLEVYLDEGRITLAFEPGNEASVGELEKAVQKAGFELAALSLEVRGRLFEGKAARLVVRPGLVFRLLEMRDGCAVPVSAETIRRLRETDSVGGGVVVVRGAVEARDEAEPSLVLQEVGPAEARAK